jgi:TRAP-type C4-dicarboxylate transport system permease small subunit
LAGISAALAIGCLIWFAIAAGSGFDLARSAGLPEWVAPLPIGAVFIAIAVAAGALGAFVSTLRRLRDYRAFEQDAQAAAREITAGDRTPVAAGREILSPHPVRSPAILLALLAGQLITFAFTPWMTASQWGTDYLDVIEGWQALLVPGLALLVLSAALLALSAHRIGPHRARILAAFPDIDPVPALYTTSDSEGRTVSHRVVEGDGRPIRVQADQVNEDPR